ncbi:hypothetical protein GCM10028805_54270 [Spirosoma harenae]
MKFEKGHTKKGGRQPGSKNKVPSDIKTRIAALIDGRFDRIVTILDELDPKDEMTAYLKFLEYILPKQREQKVDITNRLDGLTDEQLNSLIDHILNNPNT